MKGWLGSIVVACLLAVPAVAESRKSPCTNVPAAAADWRKRISDEFAARPEAMTTQAFDKYMSESRSRAISLPNPFIRIARMSPAERLAAAELVLWEDKEIMVLVDKFDTGPKGLVIPKTDGVWFPIDATPGMMTRLERISAAVSDSFILAAGKTCDPSFFSQIYIHGPAEIGVQQLHVHVRFRVPFSPEDDRGDFYRRASQTLADLLN